MWYFVEKKRYFGIKRLYFLIFWCIIEEKVKTFSNKKNGMKTERILITELSLVQKENISRLFSRMTRGHIIPSMENDIIQTILYHPNIKKEELAKILKVPYNRLKDYISIYEYDDRRRWKQEQKRYMENNKKAMEDTKYLVFNEKLEMGELKEEDKHVLRPRLVLPSPTSH